MGSSGMAIDANGKPIKKQNTNGGGNKTGKQNNNNNRGNQKGGKQNIGGGGRGGAQRGGGQQRGGGGLNNGRGGNMGRGGGPMGRGGRGPMPMPMQMIPPFQAMRGPGPMQGGPMHGGPMHGGPMQGGGGQPGFGFFNSASKGGAKNNDNRNAAPQSGYGGPSAASVGQAPIGSKLANPDPTVDVPGFGKNSNIHELFGKMVWRKMEQIRDQSSVDNLQNRIMNLIHDAIASQDQQQSGGGFNGNNGGPFAPTNQKGPAFNGFQKF